MSGRVAESGQEKGDSNALAAGCAESGGCRGGDVSGGKKGRNGKRTRDAPLNVYNVGRTRGGPSGGSRRHHLREIWDLLDPFWLGFKPKVRTLIFEPCQ